MHTQSSVEVTLHVGGGGRRVRSRSVDMSRSGIFVITRERIPEGRRVDIVIESPAVAGPIATSGIVVHAVANIGIGIRFSHQNDRTRQQVRRLIEALKQRV